MFPSLPITITPVGFLVTHKKHPQSFGQQCRQILRLIRLLIFTYTFMLLVTRMLSVKRGGVIILTLKKRQLPPLSFVRFAHQVVACNATPPITKAAAIGVLTGSSGSGINNIAAPVLTIIEPTASTAHSSAGS